MDNTKLILFSLIILAIIVVVVIFQRSSQGKKDRQARFSRSAVGPADKKFSRQERIRLNELTRIARGDEARALRLIQYEENRNPGLSRLDYINSAIERLRYENR